MSVKLSKHTRVSQIWTKVTTFDTHTNTYIPTHTHTHTDTHAHTYTYTHIYIHIHAHTHTHTLARVRALKTFTQFIHCYTWGSVLNETKFSDIFKFDFIVYFSQSSENLQLSMLIYCTYAFINNVNEAWIFDLIYNYQFMLCQQKT